MVLVAVVDGRQGEFERVRTFNGRKELREIFRRHRDTACACIPVRGGDSFDRQPKHASPHQNSRLVLPCSSELTEVIAKKHRLPPLVSAD